MDADPRLSSGKRSPGGADGRSRAWRNGDGRPDLVLGSLGHNSYLQASPREPARMYVGDFGYNGTLEQILTFYKHGVSYPLAGRDELLSLIPRLESRFATYADFGAAR